VRGDEPRTVTEFAKITSGEGFPVAFGASVAVSGDNLVVGARGYVTEDGAVGTAYVFHRSGPRWVQTDRVSPDIGFGIDGEDFGLSVAIDGDIIAVGAPNIIGGVIGGAIGDLNQRRGRIEDVGARGEKRVIQCKVPLQRMFGYSTDLRSLSQGRATYTMTFAEYDSWS
jgi:hypothetical protein